MSIERFNRTLLEEWAYAHPYLSDADRTAAFPHGCITTITTAATPHSRANPPSPARRHQPLRAVQLDSGPGGSVGLVFVHAELCEGYDPVRGLPDFVGGTPRVLRSYTPDQAMYYADNRVTKPDADLGAVLQELMSNPGIDEVHLRNVKTRCFITRTTR